MKKCLLIIFFALLAVGFLSVFSISTSFLYHCPVVVDSAIFQFVGKKWAEGYIPYVDVWELKGPIIFLVNALGYWICNSKIGVLVLQTLFLLVSLFACYKFFRMEYSERNAIGLAVFMLVVLAILTEGGNSVEEYTLPFLIISFYFLYKWTKGLKPHAQKPHAPRYAWIYGATFAICLLTRLTNALGLTAAVACVSIYLAWTRQWKNLFGNVLAFIGGFLLVLLPFAIYFYAKGSLYEMWYGTVLYNLENIRHPSLQIDSFYSLAAFVKLCANSLFLLITAILVILFNRERRLAGVMWLCASFFLLLWYVNSNGFVHYGILSIPFYIIGFNELRLLKASGGKTIGAASLAMSYAFLLFVAVCFCYKSYQIYQMPKDQSAELQPYKAMIANIPEVDRDAIVMYDCLPYVYLYLDVMPCYPYFCLQDNMMSRGASLRHRIVDKFSSGEAKWIIVNNRYIINPDISTILQEQYVLAERTESLTLLKKKQER